MISAKLDLSNRLHFERDEYGLPIMPQGKESARERSLREAEMKEVAHQHLQAICVALIRGFGGREKGLRRARREFECFRNEKPKYAKGQRGANHAKNDKLLEKYHFCGLSPADFAKEMKQFAEYNTVTEQAIEQQVRRLEKKHEIGK